MFRNDFGFRATKAVVPVAMLCVLGLHGQNNAQEFDLIGQQPAKITQNEAAPNSANSANSASPAKVDEAAEANRAVEEPVAALTQENLPDSGIPAGSDNTIVVTDGYASPANGQIVYTAMQDNGFSPSLVGQACSGPGCCSCNNAQPVSGSATGSIVYSGEYAGQVIHPSVVYQDQTPSPQNYSTQSLPVESYPTVNSYPTQDYSTVSSYPASSYPDVQSDVSSCSTCNNYVSQGNGVELGVIEGVNAHYVPASSYSAPNEVAPAMTYTSAAPSYAPATTAPAMTVSPNTIAPQPVYNSTRAYHPQPIYSSPAPTYSAPIYSSPSRSGFNSTSSPRSLQSGLAQSKAVQAAQMGLRGHLGGGLGGAKYEGVGWSNQSPQNAIENCCYWGTRPTAQIGVSKGQDGCWYACVLYH